MFAAGILRRPGGGLIRLAGVAVAYCLAVPAWAEAPTPDAAAGKAAYDRSCARCHGASGAGDGVDAKRFYPRPRDLTSGVYKIRTTASGTPPTDDDLMRAIGHGLPGSNMPDWAHLDEATRWQLVYYLKSLAPQFADSEPELVELPRDPGRAADVRKGKEVYASLGCAACHGDTGRANGLSASGLMDEWGMAIRPANLTQGWNFRGGAAPRDIAMRVLAGIDGSGMPSYNGAVDPNDAWHLAYYVASLQEPVRWDPAVNARHVSGRLPASFHDARWADAPAVSLRLRNAVAPDGAWQQPGTVNLISVQAFYNDEAVLVHLQWDDPAADTEAEARDRLAMALQPQDVAGDVVTLHAWPYEGAPALDLCYWTAGEGRPAYEVVAAGFGDGAGPASAAVDYLGQYEDGRWHVLLQRPLQSAVPQAAPLGPGGATQIAFAVWDGGNPGARAVSPWLDLKLVEPPGRAQASEHAH